MKKITTILSLLTIVLATNFNVNAQAKFEAGFELGIHSDNLEKLEEADSKSKIGSMLGVYGRYGNRFYGEIGLDIYTNKIAIELNEGDSKKNVDLKFSTFNTPLVIGYKIVENEDFNFKAFLGSSFQVLLSVKDNSVFKKSDLKKLYSVPQLGLGIEYRKFTLSFKHENSINNFFSNREGAMTRYTTTIGYRLL